MNELELILTDIFDCSRTNLYLNSSSILFGHRELDRLDRILKHRAKDNPIQYILGYMQFMGLRLKVNRSVLVPRTETEILVEIVMEEIAKIRDQGLRFKVLDIGTGSGNIVIALAKFLENLDIIAIDISTKAMELAIENAKSQRVDKSITFLESDLFSHRLFETNIEFDFIVSNPPYVPTSEIGVFDRSTIKEPKTALDGGRDGLDFYRRLSQNAGKYLKKGGCLIVELPCGQSERVRGVFSKGWIIERFIKDYQDIERICVLKKIK